MLDQQLVNAQPDDTCEQLFTVWYEGLLAWAMHHTNQQRDGAEDMVHDAFVQLVLGRAGSVLILHFFHDYFPRESASICASCDVASTSGKDWFGAQRIRVCVYCYSRCDAQVAGNGP